MKISNAFETHTKKGATIFRIYIDTNEVLSYLEQGKTKIAMDIMTSGGFVKIGKGVGRNGKPYRALHYYTWAMEPTDKSAVAIDQANIAKKMEVLDEAIAH